MVSQVSLERRNSCYGNNEDLLYASLLIEWHLRQSHVVKSPFGVLSLESTLMKQL
jgi:hypothetical protein